MKPLVSLALVLLALLPVPVVAQASEFGGDTRAHLFIYLAFAAAWIVIGGWVWRIASKLQRVMVEAVGE